MIIVGLTGSIGMGKTATTEMFAEEGCAVFDADELVHKLYAPGGAMVPIIAAVFPNAISNGAVDRAVLSDHLQNDPAQLRVLESFVHPMVAEAREKAVGLAMAQGKDIMVMDIPLLFEKDLENQVDKTVVVSAPQWIQKQRVLARPGMDREKFEFIRSRQMSDEQKRARADYIIYTDKGFANARAQVKEVINDLRKPQDGS